MTNKIYTANKNTFTFHIRVSKKCNADCSYCSSFESSFSDLMSVDDLHKSMNFISNLINKYSIGGDRNTISVQYVGGELLTIPVEYFRSFTGIVQDYLSPLFSNYIHNGQSNLIGSKDRIVELFHTLDGNVGSSLDISTQQRTVKKSSSKYQTIYLKNLNVVKKLTGYYPSSIIVIDEKIKATLFDNIKFAEERKMHLVLRPLFQGGVKVDTLTDDNISDIYEKVFNYWFLKSNIIIDPLYSMLQKRLLKDNINDENFHNISGCNFQHNCALSSLNLEPNGDLYICLDMADGKHYCIGNAIEGKFDDILFEKLISRSQFLDKNCLSCDYFSACQGGCMNESIEQGNGIFGKTEYCSSWKKIFNLIDEAIYKNNKDEIKLWLKSISS